MTNTNQTTLAVTQLCFFSPAEKFCLHNQAVTGVGDLPVSCTDEEMVKSKVLEALC